MRERVATGQLVPASDCGGKAFQLQELRAAGFPVPEFVFFDRHEIRRLFGEPLARIKELFGSGLAEGGLRVAGGSGAGSGLAEACRQARDLILAYDLSADEQSMLAKIKQGLPAGSWLAVRSSAIGEDSQQASFAGQHASFLYCQEHELISKIKECVASAWNEHALRYRQLKNLPTDSIEIAVIIQEMIFAEKSGVAFSVNINGNLAESALVAGFGPGQGVVSDQTDTDSYFVDRQYNSIRHSIRRKEKMLDHSPELKPLEVAPDKQELAVLSDKEILEIHSLLLKSEKIIKQYADIEFVITTDGTLKIVQLRPITNLQQDQLIILDNTNIVESYPGISKPLSFSFAATTYQKVFQSSLKAFGVNPAQLKNSDAIFNHLLAHYQGRIYYRLDNWYRLVQEVYPSQSLQKSWKTAVGLQDSSHQPTKFSRRKQISIFSRLAILILSYPRWTARFFKAFKQLDKQFWSWKEQNLSSKELWMHFNNSIEEGLKSWHYTLLNDYLAFALVGYVRNIAIRLGICGDETCTDQLFPADPEMESRQSMVQLSQLIHLISHSPDYLSLFNQEDTGEIIQKLKNPEFRELVKVWNAYIERFGDRSLAELKMETPTPRSNPEILVHIIKNNLNLLAENRISQLLQPNKMESPKQLINKKLPILHPARIPLLFLIKIASKGLTNRENMRFCRARIHGAARAIFIEFGYRMHALGRIHDPEDIFYLQLDDIEAFANNENLDFTDKVQAGKLSFETWKRSTPPDRIIYESINYDRIAYLSQELQVESDSTLIGTGVSAGIAEAEALVLTEPELTGNATGKILVTRMTDPGWVFLMSQAAGIISEKGSLLSHTAIIGRELGVPVVVGIHNATDKIKSGEKIKINGSTGRIDRLDM